MTREQAINHLKTVAKSAIDSGYDSAVVDAVDMAREALEQEPCDDAISRQAVLEYIDKMPSELTIDGRRVIRRRTLEEYISDTLPPVTPQPKTGHCKECKYFECDNMAKVDGIPLIVAHEVCKKWARGCKTRADGYCFLFEPQESEE